MAESEQDRGAEEGEKTKEEWKLAGGKFVSYYASRDGGDDRGAGVGCEKDRCVGLDFGFGDVYAGGEDEGKDGNYEAVEE